MSNLLERYIEFLTRKSWAVMSIVLVITCFFVFQLTNLKVDSTPYFIDRFHEERLEETVVREQFTSSKEQVFVLVVAGDGDVFSRSTIETVEALSNKFKDMTLTDSTDVDALQALATTPVQTELVEQIIQGGITRTDINRIQRFAQLLGDKHPKRQYLNNLILRAKPVHKVRSITTIENIYAEDDTLMVDRLIDKNNDLGTSLNLVKKRAADNPLYDNILLSEDLKATNIQIEFNIPDYDSPNLVKSYNALIDIIDNIQTEDALHVSGTPVVNAQIVKVLEQDNATLFPMVIVVIGLVLFFSYRRAQSVFTPILIAILSVIWAMGWMSMVGIKQNVVTTALPVFLITIGVADAIHYLNAFYQNVASKGKEEATKDTLRHLFKPLFLTTLTTMFGFFALSLTELVFVAQFGWVMVAGVFFAFVLTITILPVILKATGKKADEKLKHSSNSLLLAAEGIASSSNRRLRNYPIAAPIVLFMLFVVIGYTNTFITFDQHNTASFNENTRLRVDDAVLNQYLGGTSPLNITFHAKEIGAFKRADMIAALDDISHYLESQYETVGYVASPADFVKRIDQVIKGEGAAFSLPANLSNNMVSQYYLLYETSNGQEIRNVLDETYTHARIMVLGHTDQASVWRSIIEETDAYIASVLPEGITYKFSSVGNIQTANLNEVIASQATSLLVAIALVFTFMIFVFRSIIIGFIGVIPLVLTLGILFAVMVAMGIHLDIGTCLIAGLVFGIGVDYSIHFLVNLKRYCQSYGLSLEEGIEKTLSTVSQPIIVNSLALSLGFAVLSLSSFAPLSLLGLFVSGTMIVCAILVLIVMPVLLRFIKPKSVASLVRD